MRLLAFRAHLLSRHTYSKALLLGGDAVLLNIAVLGALFLRFEGRIPALYIARYMSIIAIYTLTSLAVFHALGLYSRIWRYASSSDIVAVLKAVTGAAGLLLLWTYLLSSHLPRSTYILNWIIAFLLVGGHRFSFRFLATIGQPSSKTSIGNDHRRVLVVGAGEAGTMVLKEFDKHPELGCRIVGLVDDNPAKLGLEIQGVRVVGNTTGLPDLIQDFGVEEVIIAIPSAPGRVIRSIHSLCAGSNVKVKTLPGVYELLNGEVRLDRVREVQIEDLLGREPVDLDVEKVAMYLEGQVVLVTGAGGSIGSEICRQIIRFRPASLVMLDHDENGMFETLMTLPPNSKMVDLQTVIADIRDWNRVAEVFARYGPAVVFHAAAHKHVHFMEQNPIEAIKTNVFGTINVARNAVRYGTARFVLISTDKAVNPSSVMGATKRVAEMALLNLNHEQVPGKPGDRATEFMVVRFGNVLGSRGSVVPLFRSQIAQGGPVSVTDPHMTRYFMTISEAVQLVIQAGAVGEGGQLFALDMGEPVSIMELAEKMIRLSGYEPNVDIPIEVVGARPGEKLCEELVGPGETLVATANKRIYEVKSPNSSSGEIWAMVEELENSVFGRNGVDAQRLLASIVSSQGDQYREVAASSADQLFGAG
ncbi:MAG: nucleoside-diphosphate sugar epimerase/dehydratase [Bacillota bacterium]